MIWGYTRFSLQHSQRELQPTWSLTRSRTRVVGTCCNSSFAVLSSPIDAYTVYACPSEQWVARAMLNSIVSACREVTTPIAEAAVCAPAIVGLDNACDNERMFSRRHRELQGNTLRCCVHHSTFPDVLVRWPSKMAHTSLNRSCAYHGLAAPDMLDAIYAELTRFEDFCLSRESSQFLRLLPTEQR